MTTAPRPDRAAALHRLALDRASERAGAAGAGDAWAPESRPRPHRPGPNRPASEAEGAPTTLPGAGLLAMAIVGLALGLAATALVVARGWDPGAVAVGPWVARPRVGTPAIDPYAQAGLAHSGEVPLSASEGLRFTATTDDTGYRLLRSCRYRIGGVEPPARFWTLTATGAAGETLQDPARRSSFSSTTVIRDLAGRVTIDLAAAARPGNWLPLTGDGPLTLTLRLYDTPLTGAPADVATAALPTIARLGCAAREAGR